MKIYNYSKTDGTFLNSGDARESPREAGVFLIPAQATDKEPPITGENEVSVFVNHEWTLVHDFRGGSFWSKETGKPLRIEAIGAIPDGATSTPPPSIFHRWVDDAWALDQALQFDAMTKEVTARIEGILNDVAVSKNYSSSLSARSYAGWGTSETNPFKEEAETFAIWCAACWRKAGEIQASILAGGQLLTVEEVVAAMPACPW